MTPKELKEKLRQGQDPFLLDLREPEQAAARPLEGLSGLNLPYREILTATGLSDLLQATLAYAPTVAAQLPRNREILVVCAQGRSSEAVAEGLQRLGYRAESLEGGIQAWEVHHEVKPLVEGRVVIYQVARPARGCLSYLVASRGEAVIIDPLRHGEVYLNLAQRLGVRLVWVLDTHAHADHLSGGPALAQRLGVPYGLHPYDAIHPLDLLPAQLDYTPLFEGFALHLGEGELRALHIPGHTLGNLAYLLEVGEERYLFTGDSLFLRAVARPDLGGKAEAWARLHRHSLQRLSGLPGNTWVLPGHYGPGEEDLEGRVMAPLGEVLEVNPGLRKALEGEEAFLAYVGAHLPPAPPEYLEIKRANLGLKAWDEEEALRLEGGRNLCALAKVRP